VRKRPDRGRPAGKPKKPAKDAVHERVKARSPIDPPAYYLLLGVTLSLAFFGLVMVFSAGTGIGLTRMQDTFFFARRQAIWLVAGFALMALCAAVDYRRLGKLPAMAWWVSLVMLVLVKVPHIGWSANGAYRWLRIAGFTIQPSEIAKLAVLVCVAQTLAAVEGELTLADMGRAVVRWAAVPAALVLWEPDMGTALAILAGPMVICFVLGMRWRDIAVAAGGLATVGVLAILVEPFRVKRFLAFLDPWQDPQKSGYQIVQSLLSFGAGGLTGAGLGAGKQKFLYLPAAHTDFIFAVIGEELGLAGTLAVVGGFALFAYAGMRVALSARDVLGRALAGGIIGSIVIQAVLNMAGVTKMLPMTGVPLPFVSFGGWALLMSLAGVGLVLSVASPARREARVEGIDSGRGDSGARLPGGRARIRPVGSARTA
jgi:cell division protein FtsW